MAENSPRSSVRLAQVEALAQRRSRLDFGILGARDMRRLCLAILMAATTWVGTAIPENDEFKQAINYVFSGNIEGRTPQLLSSILDENKCIIAVETPGNSWVYYMKEIKPDSVVIDEHNRKISFEGDDTIVEHTYEGLPKVEKDNRNSITLRGDLNAPKTLSS